MSQDRLCDVALMSLERKKQKAGFDEITDEIASIKVRKVLFQLERCVISTRKGWIYWSFDGIVYFEHN